MIKIKTLGFKVNEAIEMGPLENMKMKNQK